MANDREIVPLESAIAMLPDKPEVHTFRNPGAGMLLGCDWERDKLIALMGKHDVELAGEMATGMDHGLVLRDDTSWLFIETRKA